LAAVPGRLHAEIGAQFRLCIRVLGPEILALHDDGGELGLGLG
jgi:hypothetical protein